jgi:hypothetical protein
MWPIPEVDGFQQISVDLSSIRRLTIPWELIFTRPYRIHPPEQLRHFEAIGFCVRCICAVGGETQEALQIRFDFIEDVVRGQGVSRGIE